MPDYRVTDRGGGKYHVEEDYTDELVGLALILGAFALLGNGKLLRFLAACALASLYGYLVIWAGMSLVYPARFSPIPWDSQTDREALLLGWVGYFVVTWVAYYVLYGFIMKLGHKWLGRWNLLSIFLLPLVVSTALTWLWWVRGAPVAVGMPPTALAEATLSPVESALSEDFHTQPPDDSTLSEDFVGVWRGEGTQQPDQQTWPFVLTLAPGSVDSVVGSFEYPSLHCGGDLVLRAATDTSITLMEDIKYGYGNCYDLGTVVLTLNGESPLQYRWELSGVDSYAVGSASRATP